MTFESCIVKLTSFCNLNCTYCYMFNLEDESYKYNDRNMSEWTIFQLLDRLAEYIDKQALSHFDITLHGGEPTLWPVKRFESVFSVISNNDILRKTVTLGVQTNLYKMPSDSLLDMFLENNVAVSLSLDGPKSVNDAYRITSSGKGSYQSIHRNLQTLLNGKYQPLVKGILSVAQTSLKPEDYFQWVKSLPLKSVDVLFPIHFHYGHKPWDEEERTEAAYAEDPTIGKWYAELFDCWWFNDDPNIKIRLFNHVIALILGGKQHVDALVNDTLNMFVVSSSGDIEYPDYYRVGSNGNAKTQYNVFEHTLSELHFDSGFRNLSSLRKSIPDECHACEHHDLCGGGFLAGRNGPDGMVLNRRSVLCYDEMFLFHHIKQRIFPALEMDPAHGA
ncbi:radical SAM protein [Vibrio nigripulchritudo]|uniref:radical SAM protein n=1 Tax=Vibrio nigripulchritudo TaxID=28173 RepID=UPI001CED5BBA|nr:radical SAM protein [Vibrio nigripulchritudo]